MRVILANDPCHWPYCPPISGYHALYRVNKEFASQTNIMAIFLCPNCGHTQDVPDAYVGRTAKCLKCQARGEITQATPKPSPPNPPIVPPKSSPPNPPVVQRDSPEEIIPPSSPATASTGAISRNDVRVMIGLLAALLAAQLFGRTSTKTSTTNWEYKIESPYDTSFEYALERLGNQGWELVFARRATSEFGSPKYEMIFKRPKR